MWTSPVVVRLRFLTRSLGVNKLLAKLLNQSRYEDRFCTAFEAVIRQGDVVWDIGANVGLYTEVFLQRAGVDGRVVAFEPTGDCFQVLADKFSSSDRVILKNIAMGAEDGTAAMALEEETLAATHRVVLEKRVGDEYVEVPIRSAASFVNEFPASFPNVVKIDVEGHEGAVLDGFVKLLPDARLRCIGIEVHFGLLDGRGESDCPRQMEEALSGHGFSCRWTDPSHLLATR